MTKGLPRSRGAAPDEALLSRRSPSPKETREARRLMLLPNVLILQLEAGEGPWRVSAGWESSQPLSQLELPGGTSKTRSWLRGSGVGVEG